MARLVVVNGRVREPVLLAGVLVAVAFSITLFLGCVRAEGW